MSSKSCDLSSMQLLHGKSAQSEERTDETLARCQHQTAQRIPWSLLASQSNGTRQAYRNDENAGHRTRRIPPPTGLTKVCCYPPIGQDNLLRQSVRGDGGRCPSPFARTPERSHADS